MRVWALCSVARLLQLGVCAVLPACLLGLCCQRDWL